MFNTSSQLIHTSYQNSKQAVGYAAAQLIADGMIVGLGTGTTAHYFIQSLIERCQAGLKISVTATSKKSEETARKGGLKLIDVNSISAFDIVVDGADEIDSEKRMIKGGGGALLREKIIASSAKEMIVVVDENKIVKKLGKFPLAIEMTPFGYALTIRKLEKLGYKGELRMDKNSPFVTDNGNYVYDIHFDRLLDNPEREEQVIRNVPGIIDTGFFFKMAGRVIVGFPNGNVKIYS